MLPSSHHQKHRQQTAGYPSIPPEHGVAATESSGAPELCRREETAAAAASQRQPRLPQLKRTRAAVWCGGAACFVFGLLLVAAGVATLVVVLVIKPRHPRFDVAGAVIRGIYVDFPASLNADLAFLFNFSNPNRKMAVRFEVARLEVYFRDVLAAARALRPFAQARGEVRLESVNMVVSEVYLPPELVAEMQREVGINRVVLGVRGAFKVRSSLGLIHFTYWLHRRCTVELTLPPTSVLIAKTCRTGK